MYSYHPHCLVSVSLFAASDLDCIRALFNEKEKELSLAVAKVEELTRQLEELRGRQNAVGTGAGGGSTGSLGGGLTSATSNGHLVTPASAELEKLRRELMVSSRHRLCSRECLRFNCSHGNHVWPIFNRILINHGIHAVRTPYKVSSVRIGE